MKARMKKLISIKSILLLALVLLIVLGSALAAGHEPVSGSVSAIAINAYQFEGTATLTIGGGEEVKPSFVATLLEMSENDEGVLHAKVSHTFDFGDGNTFTTEDKAVMEPVDEFGLYTLNETLKIISGEGDFEDVSGELHVHGQINFGVTPAEVSVDIRGAISR